jgi:hypothetical protein
MVGLWIPGQDEHKLGKLHIPQAPDTISGATLGQAISNGIERSWHQPLTANCPTQSGKPGTTFTCTLSGTRCCTVWEVKAKLVASSALGIRDINVLSIVKR